MVKNFLKIGCGSVYTLLISAREPKMEMGYIFNNIEIDFTTLDFFVFGIILYLLLEFLFKKHYNEK